MENIYPIVSLSEKLLLHVKMNLDTKIEELKLKSISITDLQNELDGDVAKKTFWINIYNAYYQILANRQEEPRKSIFSKKEIAIVQTPFSLDDIEHGILRKYRLKWSYGYLPNPFVPKLIQKLAVQKIDYRIHFALNCGAKSCPPIAFYNLEKINKQLEGAMYSFVLSETSVDEKNKTIMTSRLLHWYCGDFGGKKGIKIVLKKVLGVDPSVYKISFKDYSWAPYLENYT
jgi:hypothetical protein